jgi:23S rRNA pseudouridine1911/1915/1917 synthase
VAESRRVTKEGEPVGRHAVTHTEKLESYPPGSASPIASMVRCTLETGRTHQIRVHMTHAGFPLLGDPLYGAGFKTKASQLSEAAQAALHALNRQALHAAVLGFEHPVTGETMSFESALPADMAALQQALTQL